MERKEIYDKLNEIFCDVLDIADVELKDETTADDIIEWNSLTHIQLIFEIELCFNVKFASREVMKWKNVGEMVDTIEHLTK